MPDNKIDLLIIKPGSQKKLYGDLSHSLTGLEPPLWGALLAAFALKKGHKVKAVDMEISAGDLMLSINEFHPSLIAIVVSGTNPSASTMNMVGARAILEELKRTSVKIPTLLMGLHPSSLPERTMKEEDVDMVCEGEGFETLSDLLSGRDNESIKGLWYRLNGQIRSNPRAKLVDPNDLPLPAWELFPMDKYRAHNWHSWTNMNMRKPYGVLYTSLGCPFNCSFCCINAIFGPHMIRQRDPRIVIEDIDRLVKDYGVKNIKIIDEMFAFNEKHVVDLCDLIIERKYDLNIWAYGRVDTTHETMLAKMKKAGVNWLCIGFESGNTAIRRKSSKGSFTDEKMKKVVEMVRSAGISIVANFIFGLPDDDMQTMRQTLDMAKRLNCEYANFYVCMAYPGSKLYDETSPEDLPKSWEGYSQLGYEAQPLPTKKLKSAEVLRFRDEAFVEYFGSVGYRKMMTEKFKKDTVDDINLMLKYKLKRKLLGD